MKVKAVKVPHSRYKLRRHAFISPLELTVKLTEVKNTALRELQVLMNGILSYICLITTITFTKPFYFNSGRELEELWFGQRRLNSGSDDSSTSFSLQTVTTYFSDLTFSSCVLLLVVKLY